MNAFVNLLNLPNDKKQKSGIEFTPGEIAQQPSTWKKTVDIIKNSKQELDKFMIESGLMGKGTANLILTGAGTSEFIGNSVVSILRNRLVRLAESIPTTHLVSHTPTTLVAGQRYVIISFARSGNSPESIAAYELAKRFAPDVKHIIITCNKNGDLAKISKNDENSICIFMPDETNDQSLAMTSSFSTMAFAATGLTYLDSLNEYSDLSGQLGDAAERVIQNYGDMLHEFANLTFSRACYLGSNTLFGTMQECHLKMMEMTEGRVACMFNSFIGLRHGPQVFVNDDCVVIAALSSDPYVRKYEVDMLTEMKEKKQGKAILIICNKVSEEIKGLGTHYIELTPNTGPVNDDYRIMTDVVVGQISATFKSMQLGLKPDNPSTSGTINRVVQGVKIYRDQIDN